jgi:cytochrome c6
MKKHSHNLMSLGVVLLSMGIIPPATFAQVSPSSSGAASFKAKCSMCHGPDGGGKTMMGAKLKIRDLRSDEVQKQTDGELTTIIIKGKGKMTPYDGKLTSEQIGQLVAYIRELGKKQ